MKRNVFWDLTLYNPVDVHRRFGGTYCSHIQGRKPSNQQKQEAVLKKKKYAPWSESASELYRASDRRFSAKRLPTCADRGSHVVSVADPHGRILGFLDRSRYFSIK
jgi:hypothetical protein